MSDFAYHFLDRYNGAICLLCVFGVPIFFLIARLMSRRGHWSIYLIASSFTVFVALICFTDWIQLPFDYEDERRNPPQDPLGVPVSASDEVSAWLLGLPLGIAATILIFGGYFSVQVIRQRFRRA